MPIAIAKSDLEKNLAPAVYEIYFAHDGTLQTFFFISLILTGQGQNAVSNQPEVGKRAKERLAFIRQHSCYSSGRNWKDTYRFSQ